MLGAWQHRAGVAVAVAGAELGVAFGTGRTATAAYVLAAALGVLLVAQGERRTVGGSVSANTLLGFVAGTAVCLLVGTGLLMAGLGMPWDVALWRTGIATWGAWAGVGTVVISAYFLAGLATSLR